MHKIQFKPIHAVAPRATGEEMLSHSDQIEATGANVVAAYRNVQSLMRRRAGVHLNRQTGAAIERLSTACIPHTHNRGALLA